MDDKCGNILIINGDEAVRESLGKTLLGLGYSCDKARSLPEALKCLHHAQIDLVLLDIRTGGKSGTEFVAEMKRSHPEIPVIVITDAGGATGANRAVILGAYDYIAKPFKPEELAICIERALEKRNLQLQLRQHQRQIKGKTAEQTDQLRQSFLGAMSTLSFALEAKDSYTAGHSRRVADYALAIAKKMGIKDDEKDDLRWGCLLHDLAKIAIDDSIINKKGKLTPTEYEHIMTHSMVGACVAASVVRNDRIIEVIQHHHDHYNGGGFRQYVQGEEIPLLARIAAVADAYDAMTSDRSYRQALSRKVALDIIKSEVSRQFDPAVANAFLNLSEQEIAPERSTILVVDDEESIRFLVRSILGNDYSVVEASDGQEAVRMVQNNPVALILMDFLMPHKDGLQACYEIKSNILTKTVPVIMLTGVDKEMNRKLSADLGADGYMIKPFTSQKLLETITRVLRKPSA
jgi:putative two-component system response regulator